MSAQPPVTIVVGVDGSGPSLDAVRFASRMAAQSKARVYLCAVLAPVQEMVMHDTSARPARVLDDSFLVRAREEARRGGAEVQAELIHGEPVDELLQKVVALRADILVVGVRRRGSSSELVQGSITMRLLDRAPCPVVLVP